MEPPHFVRGAADGALEQVADPVSVGRQPDHRLDPLAFEELVDIGYAKPASAASKPPVGVLGHAVALYNDREERLGATELAMTASVLDADATQGRRERISLRFYHGCE
jgi:hypothetical protein